MKSAKHERKTAQMILNLLKRGFVRREQHRVTSAYKRVFESEDGKVILEDLALKAFGFNITRETTNEELREIIGKQNLVKHILYNLKEKNNV